MKTIRVLIPVVLLMAAVGSNAGAEGITLLADTGTPAAPAIGQPGSLLEVYGIIDAALRLSTNASSIGNTSFGLSQGLFNGSRFGIRGTEGLGAGVKAIYTLEGGVVLPTGISDQQGQIFGRQAWVGVSSDYGTLTFGRQYGTFSDALGVGDVFGAGHGNEGYDNGTNYASNDAVNAFFLQEMGFRWDNSAKYAGNFRGVTVGAMAMAGNVPGDYLKNTMYAASLGYGTKDFPVSIAVGYQSEQDVNNAHHNQVGGGIKFAFDPTDAVYAFYFHSVFDAGFARISGTNSEMKTPGNFGRTDDIANVGVSYYVIPPLDLIASYYFDYAQNVQAAGDNGMRNSGLVAADYYFSKEFDVYVAGSYTMFGSALINTANGGDAPGGAAANYDNVFSVMLGARYRF